MTDDLNDVLDGLDFENESPVGDVFPEEYVRVPVSAITKIADTNTRGDFDDDDEDFQGLCSSIASSGCGLLTPLHLRDDGDGTYTLLAGKRRLRAAKKLGMRFVPGLIIKDPQDSTIVSAIENLTRSNLNPVEEARAYQVLMETFGMTQKQLADMIGKRQPQISRKLALLTAPSEMLQDLAAGRISESVVLKALQKEEKDAPLVVKIPSTDLPDGMSVSIRHRKAKVTISFEIEDAKAVGKEVKLQSAKALKAIDVDRLDSAYKSMLREVMKSRKSDE